jgi:hypothetical protein
VKADTLLNQYNITGLTGLANLLNDAQPAFEHLQDFSDALQAQNRNQALTIAETDLLNDIDDFRDHLVGKKVLPLVKILAEAAVQEFQTRGRINFNAASQLTAQLSAFFSSTSSSLPTKDFLRGLVQALTDAFNRNPLNAPAIGGICGTGILATGASTTINLTVPASGDQARGYMAIVTKTDASRELWALVGTGLKDFVAASDVAKVELMTLGKDHILYPESVWKNVFGRGGAMPYTWKTITDKISGKIKNTPSVPPTRQQRITAVLSLMESTVLRTQIATDLLLKVQTVAKDRIKYLKDNPNQRIKVNEDGYLKASDALKVWDEINNLATQGGTKGDFAKSLLNPLTGGDLMRVSTPTVQNVAVSGYP